MAKPSDLEADTVVNAHLIDHPLLCRTRIGCLMRAGDFRGRGDRSERHSI